MSEKPDMRVEDLSAVASAKAEGKASYTTALPEQKAFFKIPARFGHVPVAEEPLGYDHERRFEQHYPRIELPFQLVDTVENRPAVSDWRRHLSPLSACSCGWG